MYGKRTAGLVATAVLAATLLATSAVAGSPKVSQADRAMGERYQAMAQSRNLARRDVISPQARFPGKAADDVLLSPIWAQATGASSSSPLAQKALVERYQAMARYYTQTGQTGQAIAAYYRQAELEQARQEAAAFDWLDAGLGALAAIGTFALFGLGALGLHARTHRPARPAVL